MFPVKMAETIQQSTSRGSQHCSMSWIIHRRVCHDDSPELEPCLAVPPSWHQRESGHGIQGLEAIGRCGFGSKWLTGPISYEKSGHPLLVIGLSHWIIFNFHKDNPFWPWLFAMPEERVEHGQPCSYWSLPSLICNLHAWALADGRFYSKFYWLIWVLPTSTYVYLYTYIHTYIYIQIYIYVYTYIYIFIYLFIYTNIYICVHIHAYKYINIYVKKYIYIHIYIYVHVYIYIHIHTYIHTYIYTYIHTYIHYITLHTYHTIPWHSMAYHTIPYHAVPYRTIPYHTYLQT